MPGTLMHLHVAKKIYPAGEPLFFLGSIAPDAIEARPTLTREEKDLQHLRSFPEEERWSKLHDFACEINCNDPFCEGYLLHLYTDAMWDESYLRQYALQNSAPGWFLQYRRELGLAGSYLFHHSPELQDLCRALTEITLQSYTLSGCPTAEEVDIFRQRVYRWNITNSIGPSAAFPPELIDTFTMNVVQSFRAWITPIKNLSK